LTTPEAPPPDAAAKPPAAAAAADATRATPPGAAAKPARSKRPPAAGAKSGRRRSREFALQGLYQWLLSGEDAGVVQAHIAEQEDFAKCDRAHFDALLHGGIEQAAALDAALARHVDRKTSMLSPVEHGVLMIGVYELMHCLDIPYRVVINEAVELAKAFGGTDGHKYVNGVLDKCAADLRPQEARPARR
jgi:N utilization substance protein B